MNEQETILYRETYLAALRAALSRGGPAKAYSPEGRLEGDRAHSEAVRMAIKAVGSYRLANRNLNAETPAHV